MKVYYTSNRVEFNYAKNFISNDNHVLEIGAGNGHFATMHNKDRYTGLEFDELAIRMLK